MQEQFLMTEIILMPFKGVRFQYISYNILEFDILTRKFANEK